MKVIFAGTPEFAVPTLEKLINSNHDVIAVFTQPDRPAGRGRKLTPSPVKVLAAQHDIPVYQPENLRDQADQQAIRDLNPDVMVVVAYGLMLPQAVLDMPKHGCVNVHPSLLPRWRGAAPIQHAILSGDRTTGVATMQLVKKMDAGPVYLCDTCDIQPQESSGELHDRLSIVGADLLLQTLDQLSQGDITPTVQDESKVTYAEKLSKPAAKLDWSQSALALEHAVCAFNPWPVAHTAYQDQVLRIWEAEAIDVDYIDEPGTIIAASKEGIDIAAGDGVLRLLKLQLPGGKALTAAEFLNREQNNINVKQTVLC